MFKKLTHKYGAQRTEIDNIKFDSKLESKYYSYLNQLKQLGEVVFFLRQTPFHLPGGVRYVVDFQVFYKNGDIEFVDVKGIDTAMSKAKRKIVEHLYKPVLIKIVTKGEF